MANLRLGLKNQTQLEEALQAMVAARERRDDAAQLQAMLQADGFRQNAGYYLDQALRLTAQAYGILPDERKRRVQNGPLAGVALEWSAKYLDDGAHFRLLRDANGAPHYTHKPQNLAGDARRIASIDDDGQIGVRLEAFRRALDADSPAPLASVLLGQTYLFHRLATVGWVSAPGMMIEAYGQELDHAEALGLAADQEHMSRLRRLQDEAATSSSDHAPPFARAQDQLFNRSGLRATAAAQSQWNAERQLVAARVAVALRDRTLEDLSAIASGACIYPESVTQERLDRLPPLNGELFSSAAPAGAGCVDSVIRSMLSGNRSGRLDVGEVLGEARGYMEEASRRRSQALKDEAGRCGFTPWRDPRFPAEEKYWGFYWHDDIHGTDRKYTFPPGMERAEMPSLYLLTRACIDGEVETPCNDALKDLNAWWSIAGFREKMAPDGPDADLKNCVKRLRENLRPPIEAKDINRQISGLRDDRRGESRRLAREARKRELEERRAAKRARSAQAGEGDAPPQSGIDLSGAEERIKRAGDEVKGP